MFGICINLFHNNIRIIASLLKCEGSIFQSVHSFILCLRGWVDQLPRDFNLDFCDAVPLKTTVKRIKAKEEGRRRRCIGSAAHHSTRGSPPPRLLARPPPKWRHRGPPQKRWRISTSRSRTRRSIQHHSQCPIWNKRKLSYLYLIRGCFIGDLSGFECSDFIPRRKRMGFSRKVFRNCQRCDWFSSS